MLPVQSERISQRVCLRKSTHGHIHRLVRPRIAGGCGAAGIAAGITSINIKTPPNALSHSLRKGDAVCGDEEGVLEKLNAATVYRQG